MKKPDNLKEFKELIERYESITLEEIEGVWNDHIEHIPTGAVALALTGFGSKKCKLCINRCSESDKFSKVYNYNCAWFVFTKSKCSWPANDQTFYKILFAKNPNELLAAFKDRAAHMKQVLKNYQNKAK